MIGRILDAIAEILIAEDLATNTLGAWILFAIIVRPLFVE